MDLSSWQSKLEAPLEETVDGLDSSSDGYTDEEDSIANALLGPISSVTTNPPCVSIFVFVCLYRFVFQHHPLQVMKLMKVCLLLE